MRSGALKSTPPKPLTCRSKSPGSLDPHDGHSRDRAAGCRLAAAPPSRVEIERRVRVRLRIERAPCGETAPSTQACTASALRASGTTQTISRDFRICRTDIEIACAGTSAIEANQPSPTCCRRQASSSVTIRYGWSVVEIGGRIVEGQMAVLADADEGDIDRAPRRSRGRPARRRAAASVSPSSR